MEYMSLDCSAAYYLAFGGLIIRIENEHTHTERERECVCMAKSLQKHEHCCMKYMQTGNPTTKWPEAIQQRHYKLQPYEEKKRKNNSQQERNCLKSTSMLNDKFV